MMLTQQTIARLGALAGVIHGVISSWLYWRARPDEERWMGWFVSPLAVALWSIFGFGAARSLIRPTLSALLGAILGAGLAPLMGIVIPARLRSLGEATKVQRLLRAVGLGVLGSVVGATLGTAPRESLAGGLVGLVVGTVAALVLIASGLDKRWRRTSAVEYTGSSRWLVNIIYLAMGGALLGAELEIVFDTDRVLTGLFFP